MEPSASFVLRSLLLLLFATFADASPTQAAEGCKKQKLYVGMPKKQILSCFGEPASVGPYTSMVGCRVDKRGNCLEKFTPTAFRYEESSGYCAENYSCYIILNLEGGVLNQDNIKPSYLDLNSNW